MIKGGIGGANTKTGLMFESRISLTDAINKLKGFKVKNHKIYKGKTTVAELYPKNRLYASLLSEKGINYKDYISKRLLPDDAILVGNILYVIEIKFQNVSGSVDEKLQTCGFKLNQYKKLLEPAGIEVKYAYVLNDWFKKPEYKDVLEYVQSVGCYYFFEKIPLDFLGL